MSKFSHINKNGSLKMVDVGHKMSTVRIAVAEAKLTFPPVVFQKLVATEWKGAKGGILEIAKIAGILGAKKCPELIPLCHGLNLEDIQFDFQTTPEGGLLIRCAVKTNAKTGVEMEALCGVNIAALTIYDMCKALSNKIVIERIELVRKEGGKRDFSREETQIAAKELKGLILAGGESRRMGTNKAHLNYHGTSQVDYLIKEFAAVGVEALVSVRKQDAKWTGYSCIEDTFVNIGPMGALLSAFQKCPNTAFLVVACDLPFANAQTFSQLILERKKDYLGTAFFNPEKRWVEPLITIWEPTAFPILLDQIKNQKFCLRKIIDVLNVNVIEVLDDHWLDNANTPVEALKAKELIEKLA